jgi:peptidoglycan/xylan/chitin deacetylase (PgdA/CDA1 family)
MFLNYKYVKENPAYFKDIIAKTHAIVGDHTVDHPNLRGKPLAFQKQEICDDRDDLTNSLGVTPTIFRPPYGNYDANTLIAAGQCGMKALINWSASVNDGRVDFQVGTALRPGDIVLMHFRKTFVEDLQGFIDQCKKDGMTPVPLADFIGVTQ